MQTKAIVRVLSVFFTLLFCLPAWATWDGQVLVSDASATSLKASTLTFETGGQSLPVAVEGEDDDGNAILVIGFSGNSATAGTLTIAGPSGTKRIATPAAGAGENIVITTSGPGNARRQTALPPSVRPLSVDWPTHRLTASLGVLNVEGSNPATSGVVIPSGDPEFVNLTGPFDVDMTGGSIGYVYNSGLSLPKWLDPKGHSRNLSFGLNYSTYSGDETGRASTASGGNDVGFLFTRNLDGSTGIAAGPSGLVSESKIDVDFDRFEVSMGWPCIRDWGRNVRVSPLLSLAYTDFDYTIQSLDTFNNIALPPDQYFDERFQSVDQKIYELGVGARVQKALGQSGQFDIFSDLAVRVFRNEAKLNSQEEIVIGGSSESIDYSTKESDTNLGASIGVGAGWNFADNWRVEGIVSGDFNVPTASAINPTRGDIDRTELYLDIDTERRWSASLQVGYGFR